MHLIILSYKKPVEDINKYLEAHRSFLDGYYADGKLVFSGPQIPRNGGILLARDLSGEEIYDFIRNDPFYINDIASYQVIRFFASKYAAGFDSLNDGNGSSL